jgi:hypothetical protein
MAVVSYTHADRAIDLYFVDLDKDPESKRVISPEVELLKLVIAESVPRPSA